ncbi:MAG TPA: twin-arginine translocase TatA/TatE family subunit [Solirubrobacteraceae bacterium]|nr:twin-arginine translocase TatA/TatE family subunit [Solirubrobacteraceae bacterium]
MFRSPPVDAIVVIIIILLIMGPKRLPGIGKGLGQGMREFKDGITGKSKPEDEDKPALSQAEAMPDTTASPKEPAATHSGSGPAGADRS